MDILKEYETFKTSKEYKKFLQENKDYYLVHIMVPENTSELEIGYYNPKKDKITVFKTNPIMKGKEEDVFKEGKTITELDMKKVKLNYDEAMKKAKEIMIKDYSAEDVNKKIILLQNISAIVWNITLICKSLNIINIRINAETGEIIRNNKSSLLNMAGMMK
jgi:hypothetical protein